MPIAEQRIARFGRVPGRRSLLPLHLLPSKLFHASISLSAFFSRTLSRRRTNFQPFRALYMRNMYIDTDVVTWFSQSHLNHLAVIYTVMYQEDKFDSSCGLYDFMIILKKNEFQTCSFRILSSSFFQLVLNQ